jgi:hypothetical protein
MILLKYIISEIKKNCLKCFESINFDSFSNSIKYIKDSNIANNKQKGCLAYFKCFLKKKETLINFKTNNFDIENTIFELRKKLKNFFFKNYNEMLNEKKDSILDLDKIDNTIQDICFNKYQYISEINSLDEKLKDEVDKYSTYFNIEKIIKKQNLKIKSLDKKIEIQEENKTANECIICCEKERNTVFYPCLHLVTCEDCGFHKIKNECPQCLQKIEKKQLVLI